MSPLRIPFVEDNRRSSEQCEKRFDSEVIPLVQFAVRSLCLRLFPNLSLIICRFKRWRNNSLRNYYKWIDRGKITPREYILIRSQLIKVTVRAKKLKSTFDSSGSQNHASKIQRKYAEFLLSLGLFRRVNVAEDTAMKDAPLTEDLAGLGPELTTVDTYHQKFNHGHWTIHGEKDMSTYLYFILSWIKLLNIDKPGAGTFKKFIWLAL